MTEETPPPPSETPTSPIRTPPPRKTDADKLDDMAGVVQIFAVLTLIGGVIAAFALAFYTEETGRYGSDERPYAGLAIAVGAQAIVASVVLYTVALLAAVVADIKGTTPKDPSARPTFWD